MRLKNLVKSKYTILFGIIFLFSCGKFEWEDVEIDYDPELNVFGLISLTDSIESFVQVHRTMDLEEYYSSDYYRDHDRYVVDDAHVFISDGDDTSTFELVNDNNYYSDDWKYVDLQDSFHPQPNTNYYLLVNAPGLPSLNGELKTTSVPIIDEESIPDTLYPGSQFILSWETEQPSRATILIISNDNEWGCGIFEYSVIDLGKTTYEIKLGNCDENNDWDYPEEVKIVLQTMDDNYYQYFINTPGFEWSNLLLGGGGFSARAFGVEGGLGVFGSVARVEIIRPYQFEE